MTTIIFDTETDNLPSNWKAPVTDSAAWPRVMSIAWQVWDESTKQLMSENYYLIAPPTEGFSPAPPEGRFNGISDQQATDEGWPLGEIIDRFFADVAKADLLVAHNMSFDRSVLQAELHRMGRLGSVTTTAKFLCTMQNQAVVNYCAISSGRGYKWPKLVELHTKLFGEEFDGAHNALGDVKALARCYWELKGRGII